MFDGLYPEAADTALAAKINRPPEPGPAPRFSVWGMLTAAPKGVEAGTAQGLASAADVGGAIADKVPANVSGPLGRIPVMNFIQSAMQVGADILNPKEGQFTSEVGTSLRNVAEDYTPDPVTTHVAESAVFNLFRMGSKAVTAAATMGNVPGAVIAGTEEGFTQSDELARKGVDIKTRTKVAAVTAATNAVGFALPAAGKTWMQTGALALVGGPASFVAQNAATREILQAADYSKLADQYDPLDPVGLTLSTILPMGFGALAMRGAKAKATIHPPEDVVDAARVSLIRQQMDSANPVPNDLAAADAHVKAYTTAMDQMAAGESVHVDVPEASAVVASENMAKRLQAITEADAPPALQTAKAAAPTQTPVDLPPAATDAFNPSGLAAEASRLLSDGRSPAEVIGNLEATGTKVTPELQNMLIGASEFGGRINELVDQVSALKAQRGPNAQPFDLIAEAVENLRNGVKVKAPDAPNPLEARLSEMAVRNPTALDAEIAVEFDSAGKPTARMTLSEYLDRVKQEAAQDTGDASLLEVAATCFLSGAT